MGVKSYLAQQSYALSRRELVLCAGNRAPGLDSPARQPAFRSPTNGAGLLSIAADELFGLGVGQRRYRLAGTPVVTDPDDEVPRVLPPEIVPLAPAPDLAPVETLTSVDCPVGPERCTVPDSSRTVVRLLLAGIDLSSWTVVERAAALPRLGLVATLPDDFERFTVRRTSVAGSSETVVERRVATLGCSEVSVRVRTDVPLSRDSTPIDAPPLLLGEAVEPPMVVEVLDV